MVFEAVMAMLFSAAIVLLLRYVSCRLKSGPRGEGVRTLTVVYAKNGAAALQETVSGLMRLVDSGLLGDQIVISTEGMDRETRRAAELLAARDERLRLCGAVQVVDTWENTEITEN